MSGKWQPEFADMVEHVAKLGARDEDIAQVFGVTRQCVEKWKKRHPAFNEALRRGKLEADAQVAQALYSRATGYRWTEQQAVKVKDGPQLERVEVVDVEKQVPPDTVACIFWLKNRRPMDWRDKKEIEHEVTGGVVLMDQQPETKDAWARVVDDTKAIEEDS